MVILSIVVSVIVVLVTVVIAYVLYVSRGFGTFKKMGIPSVKPMLGMGSLWDIKQMGIFDFFAHHYKQFAGEKVFGYYEPGSCWLTIRNLDMVRDIMVKHFNCFANRRILTKEKPFDKMLNVLEDDHWRHVRNAVSPTFTTGKIRQMGQYVEQNTRDLVANLQESCDKAESVDLKEVLSCFSLDVAASTGFGVNIDSLKDSSTPFAKEAKNLMNFSGVLMAVALLCPSMMKYLDKIGLRLMSSSSTSFFTSFVDAAIENRKQGGEVASKRSDFIQLVINEESKMAESKAEGEGEGEGQERPKGLTREEVRAQGLVFFFAGYETLTNALAFTLFCLANHPEECGKLQEEVDSVLAGKPPTYELLQDMPYLDMCISEGMRMYTPAFIIDRVCNQDCLVQGINIPKGMKICFPVQAIHNDPQYYPEPEKFDPERFSAENKATRHPYAYLPFGQGPRNCVGMRLALLEMKMCIAAVLQKMTPVGCDKTVYPPKMEKFKFKAVDGLWVNFVQRKED